MRTLSCVVAFSCDLDNSNESKELVRDVLIALDTFFSNADAKIDTSVFNASRITKLYGTIAILYSRCAPLPLSQHTGSENPCCRKNV